MTAIAQTLAVESARISGFGLVALFVWAGMLVSLALVQQGVDLYPLVIG
jgi:hypothetical protein